MSKFFSFKSLLRKTTFSQTIQSMKKQEIIQSFLALKTCSENFHFLQNDSVYKIACINTKCHSFKIVLKKLDFFANRKLLSFLRTDSVTKKNFNKKLHFFAKFA